MFVIYCCHKKRWRLVRKVWCACVVIFSFWKWDLFIVEYSRRLGGVAVWSINRWLVSTVCSECILFFLSSCTCSWMNRCMVCGHSVCSVYNQLQYLNPPVCGEWFDPTVTQFTKNEVKRGVLSQYAPDQNTSRYTHCCFHALYYTAKIPS